LIACALTVWSNVINCKVVSCTSFQNQMEKLLNIIHISLQIPTALNIDFIKYVTIFCLSRKQLQAVELLWKYHHKTINNILVEKNIVSRGSLSPGKLEVFVKFVMNWKSHFVGRFFKTRCTAGAVSMYSYYFRKTAGTKIEISTLRNMIETCFFSLCTHLQQQYQWEKKF
jgi:hypothetical protein